MSEEVKHISTGQASEPSAFRLIFTLSFAGFLSGLVLVSAFLYTKPIIEGNKADAMRQAIFKVLPGTTSFQTLVLKEGKLIEADIPGGETVFLGRNEKDEVTGFAVSDQEPGFQDLVGVIYGYDAGKKTIIGYEVLLCKETPGLGDKIFKDEAFVENFRALSVLPEIVLVKAGAKQNANEVDAITGATISSRAVVNLLNKSVAKWRPYIEGYISENAQTQ